MHRGSETETHGQFRCACEFLPTPCEFDGLVYTDHKMFPPPVSLYMGDTNRASGGRLNRGSALFANQPPVSLTTSKEAS